MNKWIISAVGQDQPGIVAAISQVFFELDCNLEDTSMTQLEDHFAVLIILEAPVNIGQQELLQKLDSIQAQYNLQFAVHPIHPESEQAAASGAPWSISVSGSDHLGIVYHVTQYLSQKAINVTHLSSKRMTKASGQSLYLMALEVDVPPHFGIDTFQSDLKNLAQTYQLEIHAEPLEVYTL